MTCKEHTLVREILSWLQDRYWSWLRNPSGPASKFHGQVNEMYPAFPDTRLKDLLSDRLEFDSKNTCLYLEPINEGLGIVPVLSFSYKFKEKNKFDLRLQLALFVLHEGNLAAIGCRFDPSEGPGTHDYYHAQMFREFHGGRALPCLPSCPPWLPISRPAFHLKADDPVTLLISMVISLYGIDRVQQEFRQATFANALKPYIDRLCPTVAVRENQPAAAGPTSQRGRKNRE